VFFIFIKPREEEPGAIDPVAKLADALLTKTTKTCCGPEDAC
jgi:hypothetical protein